jgi:hypothetical protein
MGSGKHFYTTDPHEATVAIENGRVLEGIACYVLPVTSDPQPPVVCTKETSTTISTRVTKAKPTEPSSSSGTRLNSSPVTRSTQTIPLLEPFNSIVSLTRNQVSISTPPTQAQKILPVSRKNRLLASCTT